MNSVIISLLSLISVPIFIILACLVFNAAVFRKPWPATRKIMADLLIAVVITVAITISISLVFSWTGFFRSQFYRPVAEHSGQRREVGNELPDVFFASSDGTKLHGWFLRTQDEPLGTVVHLHGSDQNISFTTQQVQWLVDRGFNVFAFDYRGFGKSEGTPGRRGIVEDSVAAIQYIRTRTDLDANKICLWGQSMGGQLAIVAADIAGTEGIQAVIAEATYSSYSHQIKDKTSQLGPLWLVQWAAWLVTSDAYSANDAVERLAPTPVLLIHGSQDRGVQPYHSEHLYQSAGEPKDIWRIEGGRHLQTFDDEIYRAKLVDYLKQALQ